MFLFIYHLQEADTVLLKLTEVKQSTMLTYIKSTV